MSTATIETTTTHAHEDHGQLDRQAQRIATPEELEETVEHGPTVPRETAPDR